MNSQSAVMFVGREQAELVPTESLDAQLSEHDVYGRTLTTLVSPGTELSYGYLGQSFPISTGYASVFEVTAIGNEVDRVKVGDRALCMGSHRSDQRVHETHLAILPPKLSSEVAVFARLMAVSMTTLNTTKARPPVKVLVTGLGPVGNLAAQIFEACGFDVLAVEPNIARARLAETRSVSTMPLGDPKWAGQVDLVIECSGHEAAVADACKMVRKGGEVVMVGVPWTKKTDISAFDLLSKVFFGYVHLRSGWEWELASQPTDFRMGSHWGNLAGALEWLDQGRLSVKGLYDVRSPIDCQAVYQELLAQKEGKLSTVFHWSD